MTAENESPFGERKNERLLRQRILEMTSTWLLKVLTTEKFLRRLESTLSASLIASNIAVLVYDRNKHCYFVKMTAGPKKVPHTLLKLQETSPLIHELNIKLNLEQCSEDARAEMKRFGAEMCFPIFAQDHLTGILLVGPRLDGKRHPPETISFFQTLTNEIGVQFEKETFYISSITDPLTGLYNRKYLEESLIKIFSKKSEPGGRIALALIDIDHFKLINDRLGHEAGDQVLRVVAEKFRKSLRATDLCFRYGGEEFCVLFRDLVKRDGTKVESSSEAYAATIVKLAERIRNNIGQSTIVVRDQEIRITVSIGITFLSIGTREYELSDLIREADEMLYAAKGAGRNQVFVRPSI